MRRGFAAALLCLPLAAGAEEPAVSLVIDDLGNGLRDGRRVIALPAAVTLAILPHTTHARRLAEEAHARGKEIILHLPMEAAAGDEPGPGRLEAAMPAREVAHTLAYDLETVPHAVGVNNHMGSRMTEAESAMRTLFASLRTRGGLFFLDSRTSARSRAAEVAAEAGVPYLARDVFLDHERTPAAIARALAELERLARRDGNAVAIGHPYPETLAALETWLPGAAARGIRLVPLSAMLALRTAVSHGDRTRTARPGL
jgi:hypothetical protein